MVPSVTTSQRSATGRCNRLIGSTMMAPMEPVPAERCIGARELTEPRLSPDGRWVAFVASARGASSIVIVPVDGGPERQVTALVGPRAGRGLGGGCFDWLPDGSGVVYAGGEGRLWVQRLDGSGARALAELDGPAMAPAVSPDGRWVACVVDLAAVWCVAIDGSGCTLVDDRRRLLQRSGMVARRRLVGVARVERAGDGLGRVQPRRPPSRGRLGRSSDVHRTRRCRCNNLVSRPTGGSGISAMPAGG